MRWRRLVEYFTTEYSRQNGGWTRHFYMRTTAVEGSPARVHDLARMSCKSRRIETSWVKNAVLGCEQEFAGPLRGLPGPGCSPAQGNSDGAGRHASSIFTNPMVICNYAT